MSCQSAAAQTLARLMSEMPRGPRREGAFALWLTLRVVEDLEPAHGFPERATRRRVALLERRLSSLTLVPSIRRALSAALAQLTDDRRDGAAILSQLAASAREAVAPEAGDAMARAAKEVSKAGR